MNKLLWYINLSANGNAYAATFLAGSSASWGRGFQSSVTTDEFWEQWGDSLTSKGWCKYIAALQSKTRGARFEIYLGRAAEAGYPAAMFWYPRKEVTSKKTEYFLESARIGYPYAQAAIASLYEDPSLITNRIEKNEAKSLALDRESAAQGEPYGLWRYASAHAKAKGGLQQDNITALQYYMLCLQSIENSWRPDAAYFFDASWDAESMQACKYGVRLTQAQLTKEEQREAERRALAWTKEFLAKRARGQEEARARRAALSAEFKTTLRPEYDRLRAWVKAQGYPVPPSLYGDEVHDAKQ